MVADTNPADISSQKAFRKFFEDFHPAVYAFLLDYTGDEELSRDLAQDTFLKIYERRAEIDSVRHAKAYLYTTARRLYWDHLKHAQVEHHYRASQQEDSPNDDPFFLQAVTHRETLRILYSAIDRLPPQTRRIVLLHLEGKDNHEVADTLGISVNTVKSLKKSAYASLRSTLSGEYALLLFVLFH